MQRIELRVLVLGLLAAVLTGCGGGPGSNIDPNSGRITGSIAVDGPFDASTPLSIGLLLGDDFQVENVDVGKVTATAGASLIDRTIVYSFTSLFVSSYTLIVYTGDAPNRTIWFRSVPITLGFVSTSAKFDASFSPSGPAPFGTIAGTVTVAGTWPAAGSVFLGLKPASNSTRLLRWPVKSSAVSAGKLAYSIPSVAYGTYSLGLYATDAQGVVRTLGTAPNPVALTAASHAITDADFSANLDS